MVFLLCPRRLVPEYYLLFAFVLFFRFHTVAALAGKLFYIIANTRQSNGTISQEPVCLIENPRPKSLDHAVIIVENRLLQRTVGVLTKIDLVMLRPLEYPLRLTVRAYINNGALNIVPVRQFVSVPQFRDLGNLDNLVPVPGRANANNYVIHRANIHSHRTRALMPIGHNVRPATSQNHVLSQPVRSGRIRFAQVQTVNVPDIPLRRIPEILQNARRIAINTCKMTPLITNLVLDRRDARNPFPGGIPYGPA